MALDSVERRGLPVGEHQRLGVRVVAVGPELGDHTIARVGHALRAQLVGDVIGRHPQVFSGVVGPQVGAMAQHRSVLHQSAGLVQLLALGDVVAGEQDLARFADHPVRQRHRCRVRAVGQDAHHQKAEDHHQGDALDPALTHQGCMRCLIGTL